MRVLHIMAGLDPRLGGPPIAFLGTVIAARRGGASNAAVFPRDRGAPATEMLLDQLRRENITVYSFPLSHALGSRARRWGVSFPLARWLVRSTGRYDVVHMHGAWTFTTVIGLAAGVLHRKIRILSTDESLTDFDIQKKRLAKRIVKRLMRRLYLRLFDLIITASELEQADSIHGTVGRSVVIPHAVQPVVAVEHKPRASAEAPFVLGFLGRLDPKKNVDVLIDVLAALPKNVTLRIGGDGPSHYRDALRARGRHLSIAGRIEWIGFVAPSGKKDFFGQVDVLVVPSSYECFCISAVEALWAGVPLVLSSRTGVARLVQKHQCGIVTEPDIVSLRAAILSLSESPAMLEDLGQRAQAAAEHEFSVDAHMRRLMAEYERLMRVRRGGLSGGRTAMEVE